MKRKCIIVHSASEFGGSFNRFICIDQDNWQEIYACVERKNKKWKTIVERTLTQPNIYWDCYGQESYDDKTKGVTAIKFFDTENTRIYCKEISVKGGNFYIVCAVLLLSKKVQKNDKNIIEIIKKISNYEYEILQ